MRKALVESDYLDTEFEWRGHQVSRIENLSDIVFALALGMIVSASVVPRTFDDLERHLVSIVPVTLAFLHMLSIWNVHFTYFRRYAFTDGWIISLNAILLLFVLFVAYPLRFIFDSLFGWVLAQVGMADRLIEMQIDYDRAAAIMAYFLVGYICLFTIFAFMYAHALKNADRIGLSVREKSITRRTVYDHICGVLVAFTALAVAMLTDIGPFAGFILFLNFFFGWLLTKAIPLPRDEVEEPAEG